MGETYSLYDPGNATAGAYYDNGYGGGIDFGAGWGDTLQGVAKLAANTYAQTTLMQQNQQGQRYIEGQRLAVMQSTLGIKPSTLLLIGAAVLAYTLLKG